MKLFTPPPSNYKNYFEQGAFDLTWRYNAIMLLCFSILLVSGAIISMNLFLIGIAAWSIPALSLWVLKRSRKYELVAYFYVILGSITTGLVMNIDAARDHSVEVIFMMITVFYAFIVLRRKIGMIALFVQFFWLVIYIFNQKDRIYEVSIEMKIALFLVLVLAMVLFSFLIIEFLKLRRKAEKKYVVTNRDLTEANLVVNMQYQEKTVMLKEIHHRVKNNLQVISSLLRLQSYEIEEETAQQHFQDAIHRVSAMALIHEKMYQNENLSQINLENYIESLSADLVKTHAHGIDIVLRVKSDIAELGNDTLVPVALILNELITNSLKHAFVDRESGRIDIDITKLKRQDYFSFSYKDNGQWKTTEKGNSFGLELISTLTEQLDGKVERSSDNGTKYNFILRDLK